MRILIFGEDRKLSDVIERGLAAEGHDVRSVADSQDAHHQVGRWAADVVVVAPNGPPTSGCDLCQRLRQAGVAQPILMLGVAPDGETSVAGLAMGPDRTLETPFAFDDLIAALDALARGRPRLRPDADVLLSGDLRFDRRAMTLASRGQVLILTHKELAIVEVLMASARGILSLSELVGRVWASPAELPGNPTGTRVACINRKLADVESNIRIQTTPGATPDATQYGLSVLSR